MAWAPYFMAVQSPEAARLTLRRRQRDGATAQAHDGEDGNVDAGCVHAIGADWRANRYRRRSKLHMTWIVASWRGPLSDAHTLSDLKVVTIRNGASGGAAVGGADHCPASNRRGHCHIPPMGSRGGGFGGPPYQGQEKKVYRLLEHERICLVCELDQANYYARRPLIYAEFLAKGKLLVKVHAMLQ